MVDTVKFNVGGRHFEVSRDLIKQNPETMLAKMISETWDKEADEPLFIDRDGDLFAQVLNYLRYESIQLPPSIPQAMFERESDYYSILAQSSNIKQETFAKLIMMANEKDLDSAKQSLAILEFVALCHIRFCHKSEGVRTVILYPSDLGENKRHILSASTIARAEEHLEKYFGLTVKKRNKSKGFSPYFEVSMKE